MGHRGSVPEGCKVSTWPRITWESSQLTRGDSELLGFFHFWIWARVTGNFEKGCPAMHLWFVHISVVNYTSEENNVKNLYTSPARYPTELNHIPVCAHTCYWVQARSARCTTDQWIWEMRCWSKDDFNQGAGNWEDGRIEPQNNHLIRVWMPGSFTNQRWGEVRKQSKKTIKSCEHLLEWQTSGRGCVNFSLPAIYRWTVFWKK